MWGRGGEVVEGGRWRGSGGEHRDGRRGHVGGCNEKRERYRYIVTERKQHTKEKLTFRFIPLEATEENEEWRYKSS